MDATIGSLELRTAGLVYVSDRDPGILRRRRGRSFCYHLSDGTLITDTDTKGRIKALGIPPAYRDVWICALENGHLQATGLDDRGRKQYRYHKDWQALRDQNKFDQLTAFGDALPAIRRRARRHAEGSDHEVATLAALVLLLDATHLRVGNASYLKSNGTYGATTLLKRHVRFGDAVELSFKAKAGRRVQRRLKAPRLQRILERIADLPGRQLFVWQDGAGVVHPIDSGRLNQYLCDISDIPISAKTFRTWGGTTAAFKQALDTVGQGRRVTIKGMAQAASAELSNTAAIARKSYIHPKVLDIAGDPDLEKSLAAQTVDGPRNGLRLAEERLLRFLSETP